MFLVVSEAVVGAKLTSIPNIQLEKREKILEYLIRIMELMVQVTSCLKMNTRELYFVAYQVHVM